MDTANQGLPMKRWIAIFFLSTATVGGAGCSMCCGPYDYDYVDFGGKYQRADPQYGRLGSIFSDPNVFGNGPSADSNLAMPDEPEPRRRTEDEDIDTDRFRKELDDINQGEPDGRSLPDPDGIDENETLPEPRKTGPTASRRWENTPLRGPKSGPKSAPTTNWR